MQRTVTALVVLITLGCGEAPPDGFAGPTAGEEPAPLTEVESILVGKWRRSRDELQWIFIFDEMRKFCRFEMRGRRQQKQRFYRWKLNEDAPAADSVLRIEYYDEEDGSFLGDDHLFEFDTVQRSGIIYMHGQDNLIMRSSRTDLECQRP